MSDYSTIFPPQTYSSSFYLNALTEGENTVLVTDTDDVNDNNEEVKQEKNSPILDCFIATMNNKLYLLIIAFLSSCASNSINSTSTSKPSNGSTTVNTPQIKTCFIEKTRRVRTFPTLVDYQGNRFSFDPKDSTYQGNVVNFNFSTIYSLSNNDFLSFGSDSIVEIDLHHKGIKSIGVGSFKGLFCLSKLDLSYNNLGQLTEGGFEGLENLKELYLNHNQLIDIPDSSMAFLTLKGLELLDLSFNKIKALDKLPFTTLLNLEILNLSHNKIKTIDYRVFNYLAALRELYLGDNLLVEPFADKWKGLENLTTLDLSDNYLISFDTSANYSFYNLKRLNISGNSLQFLNVYWIRKNFHNLASLDLANNSWFCEDLEAIRHGIMDLRITIPREVSCSEIKTTSPKTSTTERTSSAPTPSVVHPTVQPQPYYGAQLLEQNNRIIQGNEELAAAVGSLKTIVIVILLLIAVGVAVNVGVRMGVFNQWSSGVRGRSNRGYLDSNNIESVGLLNR